MLMHDKDNYTILMLMHNYICMHNYDKDNYTVALLKYSHTRL